jgi:hypothetical protein
VNTPAFTAEASLYRTSGHYRSSGSEYGGLLAGETIVPTFIPGAQTQRDCNTCLKACATGLVTCTTLGAAGCGVGCIASLLFYGACFAGCMGTVLIGCDLAAVSCVAACSATVCCPKICGTPNPFDPGQGCCDENEQCVDRYDPNSRQGCCPSDQHVCGGKCCAQGYSCCGDTCCPPDYYCRDGRFCSEHMSDLLPPPGTPPPTPPKRPINYCKIGWQPCGGTCCAPGLQCCDVGGGVACMTSCLH